MSARLTNVIGPEYFFLRPEEDRHALSFVLEETRKWAVKYPDEYPNFSLNGPAIYSQDGDDIVAEPNEQFLEVHVGGRYYGEDYARGDWKSLSWIMLWCIFNIPDCEVWYGGDSSGICAERMTSGRMNQMTKYYLTEGNDAYWMNSKTQYSCEFCGSGVTCSGGGGGIGFWHCDSCGTQWITNGDVTMLAASVAVEQTSRRHWLQSTILTARIVA
jgi:ribosomal protein L37AE/L43A